MRVVAVGNTLRIDGKLHRVVDIVRSGTACSSFYSKYALGEVFAVVRPIRDSWKAQPLKRIPIKEINRLVGRMKRETIRNCD